MLTRVERRLVRPPPSVLTSVKAHKKKKNLPRKKNKTKNKVEENKRNKQKFQTWLQDSEIKIALQIHNVNIIAIASNRSTKLKLNYPTADFA